MALNIPMPESPGTSLLQGLDTGSSMMSRIMQPILEREKLKQQQGQFVQELALKKQAQDKANALLPYMIQQYQDTHRTAAGEAEIKEMYRNILKSALNPQSVAPSGAPGRPPQMGQGGMPPQMGGMPTGGEQPQLAAPIGAPMAPIPGAGQQEHELRAGNPRLAKLDSVAGLVPGIPKPVTHFSDGMVFTTYPSGRMTVQKIQGAQTPGQKNVSAKEASKIRDKATALVNSANLINQGYNLLGDNPDLTGPGNIVSAIPIPFSGGSKVNLSNNPELGKFTTVTGKLQAELGKYAASSGGIQAVKWAGSVKPSPFNGEGYNYGMFEGIQQNLQDDYKALNDQYKAATGEDLPISLPAMQSPRVKKGSQGGKETGKGKEVQPDFIRVNGKLVRAK